MLTKIVVLKNDKQLEEAWKAKTFSSAAKQTLEHKLKPKGFTFDEMLYPVPLRGRANVLMQNPQALGFDYNDLNKPQTSSLFIIRANFDNHESIQNLLKKILM